ncbi:MAG: adenosylcobalamin-dependent ribonucleoside-diphosphate reductase [Sedimentisphaerales bacterium]|nr:adenosylcobalamin-dependent ribonucleoside-diphosphate reductase [Sedimentisphaerales bacterium]
MSDESGNVSKAGAEGSVLDISSTVLAARYLMKDEQGRIAETTEQMYRRVALAVAKAELKYGATDSDVQSIADEFFRIMVNGLFLPNTPTLMNAGRKDGMLSACFVIPIEDSIEAIFEAVKLTALIQKAGGGTGFTFDKLRPAGDIVRSSGGKTSGPMSFWRVFSQTTDAIQQGAFRRGANIAMMSIDHPDILKFITAKRNYSELTNFNISVKVDSAFFEKLRKDPDAPHVVTNPRTRKDYVIPRSVNIDSYTIDDLLPSGNAEVECYTIRDVWEMVIENAHATGEPGLCFIDRVNEDNPTPNLGRIEATNPCGEQPLLPYEACNLGSINVTRFVTKDATDLDWESLAKTIELAVRFLDDVIGVSYWPVPEIREITLGNRKIGLGIMGFADTLILLGIRYDSEEAVTLAEKLACFIQEHAHNTSQKLAADRGKFPNWAGSTWDIKYHRPMRNAACTTIAPTGTISLIAGCNGGIEPVFSIVSRRNILDGKEFVLMAQVVEGLGVKEGWMSEEVRRLLVNGTSPKDILEIPRKIANALVTAHEISPQWHVRIQAAFQKHVDNAVSKTVNLTEDATIEDVDKVFHLAHELGCKGITVYRDRARPHQVINAAYKTSHTGSAEIVPRPRTNKTKGETTKFRMGCGTLFVTINEDDDGLCEVFANLGKAGGCPSQSEATARALSVALRSGIDPAILVEQLKGIRCLSTLARRKDNKNIDVLSCPDAIARAIEDVMHNASNPIPPVQADTCPDCGLSLHKEAGCFVCVCGYTKCG